MSNPFYPPGDDLGTPDDSKFMSMDVRTMLVEIAKNTSGMGARVRALEHTVHGPPGDSEKGLVTKVDRVRSAQATQTWLVRTALGAGLVAIVSWAGKGIAAVAAIMQNKGVSP